MLGLVPRLRLRLVMGLMMGEEEGEGEGGRGGGDIAAEKRRWSGSGEGS